MWKIYGFYFLKRFLHRSRSLSLNCILLSLCSWENSLHLSRFVFVVLLTLSLVTQDSSDSDSRTEMWLSVIPILAQHGFSSGKLRRTHNQLWTALVWWRTKIGTIFGAVASQSNKESHLLVVASKSQKKTWTVDKNRLDSWVCLAVDFFGGVGNNKE